MSDSKNMITYPTNYDIYIEANGEKVAVVRNYTVKYNGQYIIELNHVYLTDEAICHDVDILKLKNFNFIVKKHDRIIKYTNCNWCLAYEGKYMDNMVIDKIKLTARNREEFPSWTNLMGIWKLEGSWP